jgi:hypothetical protein
MFDVLLALLVCGTIVTALIALGFAARRREW